MLRKEYLLWAIESIKNNKLRALLSMLGIIIGVSSVIVMLAIWEWAKSSIVTKFESMWANLITVRAGSSSSNVRSSWWGQSSDIIDDDLVQFLSGLDGVKSVSPTTSANKQIIYGDNNTSATINWVTPGYKTLKSLTISSWRFVTNSDIENMSMVAVIWHDLAETLFWSGVDPIGKDVKAQTVFLTIVGVLSDNSSSNSALYVPASTVLMKINWSHYYSSVLIEVKNTDEVSSMVTYIEEELMKHLDVTDEDSAPFSVSSMSEMLSSIEEVTGTMTAFLAWIAAISLIVWWIWVMNIMLVSVTERTREIGIRKAIWACQHDILRQFLIESIFLSVFAWLLWIWLSFGINALLSKFTTTSITSNSIAIAFGSAVTIWVVFGILPASKASKLKPVDALRYE